MDERLFIGAAIIGLIILVFTIQFTLKVKEILAELPEISFYEQSVIVDEEPPDIRRLNPYRIY